MYDTAAGPLPACVSNFDRKIVDDSDERSFRLYQVWKGNNRFCCGGRVMFGPDARSLFLTAFSILTPVVLFSVFISEGLVREFGRHNGILIVAMSVLITSLIIILLFLTSGSDPGIIPRSSNPPEPDDDTDCSNVSMVWPGRSGPPSLPPTKDVTVNGIIVKVKYCQTCMLYRPPRCSHCSICNNCVERFDHHCPWVGQCIGKRNYRFFFMFIASTTVLCLYVFTICWVNITWMMRTFDYGLGKALTRSPVSGILILYTFIAGWFVGGLTTFHFYLILSNQTTYENCRYQYDGKMNPHNRGCALNFAEVLLSEVPASKNNFRAKINVDQSSEYNHSVSVGNSTSPLTPKMSYDVESGKRQAVAAEDLEDIQSHMGSVRGLERCGTQPPHANWESGENWQITPDIKILATEFGMQYDPPDGQKLHEEPKAPGASVLVV